MNYTFVFLWLAEKKHLHYLLLYFASLIGRQRGIEGEKYSDAVSAGGSINANATLPRNEETWSWDNVRWRGRNRHCDPGSTRRAYRARGKRHADARERAVRCRRRLEASTVVIETLPKHEEEETRAAVRLSSSPSLLRISLAIGGSPTPTGRVNEDRRWWCGESPLGSARLGPAATSGSSWPATGWSQLPSKWHRD